MYDSKMKYIAVFTFLFAVATAEFYELPEELSPEALAQNEAEIQKRLDCYLDKQPCEGPAAAYKSIGKEMLKEKCAKCTPEQKKFIAAFIKGMKLKKPEEYKELIMKYDPEGIYIKDLEAAVGL